MEQYESRLVKLARRGDRSAFTEIVELYQDKLYRLGYRMLGNPQEAEEIVQEAFLRVYRNLDRYDPAQKFSTWIFRIATNLSIDRLRRRKPGFSLDADMSDDDNGDWYEVMANDEPLPEQQIMLSETQDYIRKAIGELPEKYKSIVILKYLEDRSLQEISDILELPVTTIKTRVHRAREYLRGVLEQKQLL